MAYAQLGSIVFDKLVGFVTFEMSGAEKYAEHALINLQPRLDHTGTDLRQIKFDVRFHTDYCIPAQKSAALWAAKNTASILTLVLGNGTVVGDFVITDITDNVITTFPDGTYLELVSSIVLKECVIADKLTQANQDASNLAAAVTGNKPYAVRNFPKQFASPTGITNNSLLTAIWQAAIIEYMVTFAASNPAQFALNSLEANTALGDLLDNMDTVMSVVTPAYEAAQTASVGFIDWVSQGDGILSGVAATATAASDLQDLLPMTSGNIISCQTAAATLVTATYNLRIAQSTSALQNGLRHL